MKNIDLNRKNRRAFGICVLLLALGLPALLSAAGFTFGMQYSGTASVPGLPTSFRFSGPVTGCTGTDIAVGAEVQTANGKNIGIQMLCATPSAIGFWTSASRATFIGVSGTGVIRALCPSSTAITGVRLDILGLGLTCGVLQPDLTNGTTTVGTAFGASASVITNDLAPISQGNCLGTRIFRTDRFVQFFGPSFAADGSLATLEPLCNNIANGVQSGVTLTPTVIARTVGQSSFQTAFSLSNRFHVELFLFGALPQSPVGVDLTTNNLQEIGLQQDFNGSLFAVSCTANFLPLSDGQQLFRGMHCPVAASLFASTGKFDLGEIHYEPRAATENGASLPIVIVDVNSVNATVVNGPGGVRIFEPGLIGGDAAFPVVVTSNF